MDPAQQTLAQNACNMWYAAAGFWPLPRRVPSDVTRQV